MKKRKILLGLGVGLLLSSSWVFARPISFIDSFKTISEVASTVPANGDVNPYGVAVVPMTIGKLVRGNVLVSNFNNSANLQGTGTTIVQVAPDGTVDLFAEIDPTTLPGPCPGGVGLTTALVALSRGMVIVGSLPTTDGTAATTGAGCLIVLDSQGTPIQTISGAMINGPWDMTAFDAGRGVVLFVSNVLNGTVAAGGSVVNQGTVVRIRLFQPRRGGPLIEMSRRTIASGFGERTDPAALVIGPTGLGLAPNGVLYVADTLANRIAAIPQALFRVRDAGIGMTVSTGGGLNGPLGLAVTPGGRILATNGGDGNLVEINPLWMQVAVRNIDTTGAGAGTLFGLAIAPRLRGIYFVNDDNNTLQILK